jgi:spermidine/putrescine-binding protein
MSKKLIGMLLIAALCSASLFAGGAQEESENVLTVVNWKDYGSDWRSTVAPTKSGLKIA